MRLIDQVIQPNRRKAEPQRQVAPRELPRAPKIKPMPALEIRPKRSPTSKGYVVLAMFIILLTLSPEIVGQALLIGYGLLVIIRHPPLQMSFGLAVLFLMISPLFTWLTGSEDNGVVLAGYSFVFLAVGLLQLIIGYRRIIREKRHIAR